MTCLRISVYFAEVFTKTTFSNYLTLLSKYLGPLLRGQDLSKMQFLFAILVAYLRADRAVAKHWISLPGQSIFYIFLLNKYPVLTKLLESLNILSFLGNVLHKHIYVLTIHCYSFKVTGQHSTFLKMQTYVIAWLDNTLKCSRADIDDKTKYGGIILLKCNKGN